MAAGSAAAAELQVANTLPGQRALSSEVYAARVASLRQVAPLAFHPASNVPVGVAGDWIGPGVVSVSQTSIRCPSYVYEMPLPQ